MLHAFRNALFPLSKLTHRPIFLRITNRFSKHVYNLHTSTPFYLKSSWEPWEDTLIQDFIAQNGNKYTEIVEHCLPHRTVSGVEQRWTEFLNPDLKRGGFSKQELEALRRAVTDLGEGHWTMISKDYLPQRSPRAIRYAYYYHCAPLRYQQQRGKMKFWTAEEDKLLLQGYQEFGRQWIKINRKYLPHRSNVGIRDRYDEKLDPAVKTDRWSESEYDLLLRRHIMYGEDWIKIAEGLDGRTPRACQRKWFQKVEPSLNNNNTLNSNITMNKHVSNRNNWSFKETKLFWHLACAHDCHWPRVAKIIGRDRISCSHKFYYDIHAMQPLLISDEDKINDEHDESNLKQRSNETVLEWKRRIASRMRDWVDSNYTLDTDPAGALVVTGGCDWTEDEIEKLKTLTMNMQRIHWRKIAAKVGKSAHRCRSKYIELQKPKVHRERWSTKEDEQLLTLIDRYGMHWENIAKEMKGTERSISQCKYRWHHKLKYKNQHIIEGRFNQQEKMLVREGVHMFGNNWNAIAKTYLPNRTPGQCMRWWKQYGQNTGNWTQEEDDKLRFAIQTFGEKSAWKDVADLVLTRTPSQCRNRWLRTLSPDIKRGLWSQEEQIRLAELVQTFKDQSTFVDWHKVAEELATGRTSWACKDKYQYMVQTGNQYGLRYRSNKGKL
ncbi:hypothetical protein BDA99DRAFT_513606 [Phascolomyces articulosus]|uniref:Uncharacterized protein n=1 Tax=Phascolomyces articulosus TaxID=60185 RepID=A0AAD5JY28_9FUNG|nr:hypothetical protein BDA99DRAFT_513606 [Phascolomyces articulosus]